MRGRVNEGQHPNEGVNDNDGDNAMDTAHTGHIECGCVNRAADN